MPVRAHRRSAMTSAEGKSGISCGWEAQRHSCCKSFTSSPRATSLDLGCSPPPKITVRKQGFDQIDDLFRIEFEA